MDRSSAAILESYLRELLNNAALYAPDSKLAEALSAKKPEEWSWSDAAALEHELLRKYPLSRLRRETVRLRGEYKESTSPRKWQDYVTSKPPDPDANPDNAEELLRADCLMLHQELEYLYSTIPVYEERRRTVLLRLAAVLAMLVVFAVLFVSRTSTASPTPGGAATKEQLAAAATCDGFPFILVVLYAGSMGALVSLWRRLYQIPLNDGVLTDTALSSRGTWTLYLSPLMGAIGAAVLYILFASGLVAGEVFPHIFTTLAPKDPQSAAPFHVFAHDTGPIAAVDHAKLVVWSFIAGFSERLWLDMVDVLIARSKQS